jgi:hypothetical protein
MFKLTIDDLDHTDHLLQDVDDDPTQLRLLYVLEGWFKEKKFTDYLASILNLAVDYRLYYVMDNSFAWLGMKQRFEVTISGSKEHILHIVSYIMATEDEL